MSAEISSIEMARISALTACRIMDTPREPAFDNIVFTLAQLFRAPMAALTLVDASRSWAKAHVGMLPQECDRSSTFCQFVVLDKQLLIIEDATTDARFARLSFVAEEPRVRFCAGAPLLGPDRQIVGALCVFDRVPRSVQDRQRAQLHQLAAESSELLRLRVPGLDLSVASA